MLNRQVGEVTPIMSRLSASEPQDFTLQMQGLVDLGVLDHKRTRRRRDPAVLPVLGMSAPIRKGYADSARHRRTAGPQAKFCAAVDSAPHSMSGVEAPPPRPRPW
jgi:hypothetical protein